MSDLPPTRARGPQFYRADALTPSRDTILCPSCSTVLSGSDFPTDALGRLMPPVCPNQHRHASGWHAPHADRRPLPPNPVNTQETYAPPVKEVACCEWPDCRTLILIRWGGRRKRWCADHVVARAKETHAAYRERSKDFLRERRALRRNRRSA